MSAVATENRISGNGALAPVHQQPAKLVSHDNSAIAYVMDTAKFEHTQRIAKMMSLAAFMPKHLVSGTPERSVANCMMVLSQAMRWQMDPFAVAPETYEVQGKMSYQGKLVAAVVNARGGLHRSLDAIYSNGKGDALAAVIYGSRDVIPQDAKPLLKKYANEEDRDALTDLKFMGVMAIRVSVGQCKTSNKMWTADPEQKLFYTGATKWARRFTPELMMGVITDEDIDRMSVQGGLQIEPGTAPRTLDDLERKVSGEAPLVVETVKVVEPITITPSEPKEEQSAPTQGKVIHPDWVQDTLNQITDAKKFPLLQPIGNDLLSDYRNPDVEERAKTEYYPMLFTSWVEAGAKMVPASGKPAFKATVEGWSKYLPAELHAEMMGIIG